MTRHKICNNDDHNTFLEKDKFELGVYFREDLEDELLQFTRWKERLELSIPKNEEIYELSNRRVFNIEQDLFFSVCINTRKTLKKKVIENTYIRIYCFNPSFLVPLQENRFYLLARRGNYGDHQYEEGCKRLKAKKGQNELNHHDVERRNPRDRMTCTKIDFHRIVSLLKLYDRSTASPFILKRQDIDLITDEETEGSLGEGFDQREVGEGFDQREVGTMTSN